MAGGLALGQGIGRGALALALLLLVRHLPPADFAKLALAMAIIAILATFADAGFARLLVRDTARARGDAIWIVRELLRVRLRAVAAAALAAAVMLALGPGRHDVTFGLLAIGYLVCESVAFGYENAAVGAERPLRFVVAQSLSATLMLGGISLLIATDTVTLTNAMAVFVGASVLKVCGHLAAWSRNAAPAAPQVPPRSPRVLFRQALPFLGLAVLATVYYRVGVIALYAIRGPSETAPFAAASRVVDAIALLAAVSFLTVSPRMSRMHRDHPEQIWSAWLRQVRVVATIVLPFAVTIAIAAEPICGLLFGDQYRTTAADELRLMVPGAALMVVQGLGAAVVFMSDDHREVLKLTALNVAACIALTVVLSLVWGSRGAALAVSVAEALSVLTFAMLIRRRHRPMVRPAT